MTGVTYLDKKKGDIRNVLVVYPYTYINPYFCLPPLAAEYLQAGIVATGRQAILVDMRFEEDVRGQIAEADLVCLYGFFEDCSIFGKWQLHVIDEVLAQVPDDTPVVAGGTGFGDAERTFATYPKVDVVIQGMPHAPIQELLEGGSPEGVRNATYRAHGELVRNPRITHPMPEDLYPRRDLRNPAYEYHVLGVPVDLMRAAMGCNYRCRFCYQYGKDTDGNYLRWQGRSAQSQYRELAEIPAPFVFWVDDDMTTDMKALDELADLIIGGTVKKVFIGTGRVDHVVKSDVSVLHKLERAGFLGLAFGVESLNDATLRYYRKGQTVDMAERAMRMMSETNILLFCNFLLGSPGETEQEMMEFLRFGQRWNVDTLVTNRLRVPEGGDFYQTIYDAETDEFLPGMRRIRGRELKRIKSAIKYGQRTPFRLALSILKLHRHRGLFIDPLYFMCCALETVTRHTWIEKTRLVPVLLFLPKKLASLRAFRACTRLAATVLTPPVYAVTKVFEAIDRQLGFSTSLLPAFFDLFSRSVLEKQKLRAQTVASRPIVEGG